MEPRKRRTRMYEPWGFVDENNYQSTENEIEVDLQEFFAQAVYNKDDFKIHFSNKEGVEKATIDVTEFIKSDTIVESAKYEDGKIIITFTNGDVITIDVEELLDENEFKDGLQVNDGVVSVLLNVESDEYLTVDENGVKLFGVKRDIEAEEARAISAETALDEKIDAETDRAMAAEAAEEQRATDEETRIETKLDGEIARAKEAEVNLGTRITTLNDELDAEKSIREAADTRLDAKIDGETNRATSAEAALDAKIDDEVARATSAETALDEKIEAEANRAASAETELQSSIEEEGRRAQDAETALDTKIDGEITRATEEEANLLNAIRAEVADRADADEAELERATSAETALDEKIDAETARATSAETELDNKINAIESDAFADVEYISSGKTINFYNKNGEVVGNVDTTDFVKDGMIDDVKIENGKLVITFNTDSGKEIIEIPLTDIFDPSNYYTKTDIDDKVSVIDENIANEVDARESGDTALEEEITALTAVVATKANTNDVNDALALKADKTEIPTDFYTKGEVDGKEAALQSAIDANAAAIATKVDKELNGTNGKALIFNETDGGGAKFEHSDGTWSFAGVNDGGENGIAGQIYALKKNEENKMEGTRIDVTKGAMYYTVGADAAADRMVPENEIAVKGDFSGYYSQEEVDTLIRAKETEIYNLTKLVGEIGGNVTYTYPNELGTSVTELLKNNGTVKLTEDATISRFGPGVAAKNKVTLNLNNHNLTSTGASSYGAIQTRGTQELTIGGKGTIDAGDGICIEANGTSTLTPLTTINLTGSTTTYRTNRPGGELVYCYVGIINISNGTFRNDGASNYTLNCYDANYRNGTAKIIVTGGKFYDFNPADNSAEGEHTSFLAEGYHVEVSTVVEDEVEHTVYTVKKDA